MEPVRLLKNSKNSLFEVPDPLICSQMELRQNGTPYTPPTSVNYGHSELGDELSVLGEEDVC